jgi:hypothetical protein
VKRPWLVRARRTSWRTGKVGKWRVLATYASRSNAIDAMLKATSDQQEAEVTHRETGTHRAPA